MYMAKVNIIGHTETTLLVAAYVDFAAVKQISGAVDRSKWNLSQIIDQPIQQECRDPLLTIGQQVRFHRLQHTYGTWNT